MSIVLLGETLQVVDQQNIILRKSLNLVESTSITFNSGSKIIMKNTSTANLPVASNITIGNTSTSLNTIFNNQIPKGCIIIWSGTQAQIPSGWSPCHGGTINGVEIPDLRDLFIIGESSTNAVGVIGGNENNTRLIVSANLPSHNHTGILAEVNAVHGHSSDIMAGNGTGGPNRPRLSYKDGGGIVNTSGVNQNHGHSITFTTVGGTTPVDIRPPYYSLIYIISTGT